MGMSLKIAEPESMKVNYNAKTDTLTLMFRDVPVAESDEDKSGVILDSDAAGNIVSPARKVGAPQVLDDDLKRSGVRRNPLGGLARGFDKLLAQAGLASFIPCRGVLDFFERPPRELDAARQRGNG
jgi:hypothetical protein